MDILRDDHTSRWKYRSGLYLRFSPYVMERLQKESFGALFSCQITNYYEILIFNSYFPLKIVQKSHKFLNKSKIICILEKIFVPLQREGLNLSYAN